VKKIVVVMGALVFCLNLVLGCVNSSKEEEKNEIPICARKQHDTRVFIVCKDSNGQYLEKSLHITQSITCGKSTFKLEDFVKLKKADQYIAFPGQENELKNYLTKTEHQ
jgi:hypothetical protein